MSTLDVKEDLFSYHLEDDRFVCDHNEVTIERACCSSVGSSGYIECGCNGRDSIVCDNKDCTGLDEDEVPEFNNDCWG